MEATPAVRINVFFSSSEVVMGVIHCHTADAKVKVQTPILDLVDCSMVASCLIVVVFAKQKGTKWAASGASAGFVRKDTGAVGVCAAHSNM